MWLGLIPFALGGLLMLATWKGAHKLADWLGL